ALAARLDEEIAADRARLCDRLPSGPDAALARDRRRGDYRRVAAGAITEREGLTGEVGIGPARGRNGEIRNEEAGDAGPGPSRARLPHDECPSRSTDAAANDRNVRIDAVEHDQPPRAAGPAD